MERSLCIVVVFIFDCFWVFCVVLLFTVVVLVFVGSLVVILFVYFWVSYCFYLFGLYCLFSCFVDLLLVDFACGWFSVWFGFVV